MTVDTPAKTSELLGLVRSILDKQDTWRDHCLNLIASENVLSPAARSVLDSDLLHRYAEGHPGVRYYEGTRYVDEVETLATEAMMRIFRATYADVRPISGTVANEAVFSRLVPQGAVAIAHNVASGGHISHARIGSLGKRTNRILPWPMTADGWRIDVGRGARPDRQRASAARGRRTQPVPLPRADRADPRGLRRGRDARPLRRRARAGPDRRRRASRIRCARAPTSSPAPRTRRSSARSAASCCRPTATTSSLRKTIDKGVFPGSSSNHHLFSLPSLLVSALEMETFGAAYAQATIAQRPGARGARSHRQGFDVAAADLGYTRATRSPSTSASTAAARP